MMAKSTSQKASAKPSKAVAKRAPAGPSKKADVVSAAQIPASSEEPPMPEAPFSLPPPRDQPLPEGEQPSPAPLNFNQLLAQKIPLVRATGDGCDGLFAEITEPNGVTFLHTLTSKRVAEEMLLLHEDAFKHDPDAVFTDRIRKLGLAYLQALAHRLADRRPVNKRLAWSPEEGAIYLDLSARDGRCVRATADDWGIVVPAKPLFARFHTQRPLPVPRRVASEEGAAAFAHMVPGGMSPEASKLLLGAMLGCLIPSDFAPSSAYPVIVVRGDQGSGKSTLCRFLKILLDNEVAPIAAKPNKADDIFVVAQTAHILSFDNLVRINPGISDAICQATTKSAVVKRRLYSDSDQTILRAHTAFLLNGICPLLQRADIIDRSISIHLSRLDTFDPEAGSDAATVLPKVLGFLLDLVVRALANYSKMQLEDLPRLATVAKFVAAAEPLGCCDTPFVTLLRRNQAELLTSVDEHHPVVDALFELMAAAPKWTGTYKDLLTALAAKASTEATHSPDWCRTERKLSAFLLTRTTMLRELGIVFQPGPKRNNGRMLTLTRADTFAYSPSTTR